MTKNRNFSCCKKNGQSFCGV